MTDTTVIFDDTSNKVSEVIDGMAQLSDNMVANVEDVMDDMAFELATLSLQDYFTQPDDIEYDIPNVDINLNAHDSGISIDGIDVGAAPTLDAVGDIDDTIPENSNVDFNITIPQAPSITIGDAPTSPGMATIDIPAMPDYTLPDVPDLDDIVIPQAPEIDISEFSAVAPSIDPDSLPEVPGFDYTEEQYQSDIGVALFQKILDDIASGGSGLNPNVEQAIYDRMLARQRAENEALYRQIEDQYSSTGFELPTGALASRLLEAASEISRKNDQASWEIMIKQAELAQNNTQFTVDKAVAIEQMLRDFFNKQEERRIEAARQVALIAVEVFKALVQKIEVELDIYKAEASVYSERLKAKLAEIDIYRAKIDGTRVQAEIQQARVNIYNAQIAGVEALMKIYSVQMESARIRMEMEVAKMEGFKAEIQAYIAEVDAQRSKVGLFQAQVDGAKAQVDLSSSIVNKYRSEVEAAKARIEAQSIAAQAIIEKNKGEVEVYRSQIEAAKVQVDTNIAIANVQLEEFKTIVNQEIAEADLRLKSADVGNEVIRSKVSEYTAKANMYIEDMKAAMSGYLSLKELLVNGYGAQITGYGNIAASALNAMNVNASLQASGSANYQNAEQRSLSASHNHSYEPAADNWPGPF